MREDPGLYDYLPYYDRPKIVWPGGAQLAFWCAPNIEHYELDPPVNPSRTSWPRPVPDVLALRLAGLRQSRRHLAHDGGHGPLRGAWKHLAQRGCL